MSGRAAEDRKTVRVAAAVILRDGSVFAARRKGGGWEFPGGKIESGETPEAALVREIREEFDTLIMAEERLATVERDDPGFHLTMYCIAARVLSGGLGLKEHEAAGWFRPDEAETLDWLPADRVALPAVLERLARHGRKEET